MAGASGAFEYALCVAPGMVAGADLSTKKYLFVKEDNNGRIVPCTVVGEPPLGVLQNQPSAVDRAASVAIGGITKVVAGAAFGKGAYVATDAQGRAVPVTKSAVNTSDAGATTDPLVGGFAIGRAMTGATAAGDVVAVFLTHSGAVDTTAG